MKNPLAKWFVFVLVSGLTFVVFAALAGWHGTYIDVEGVVGWWSIIVFIVMCAYGMGKEEGTREAEYRAEEQIRAIHRRHREEEEARAQ
jgi:hypothetical protein